MKATGDRVRKYEIQIAGEDGAWTTVASGEKIGPQVELRFEPVIATRIRLNILDATEGPTIWEMRVFGE